MSAVMDGWMIFRYEYVMSCTVGVYMGKGSRLGKSYATLLKTSNFLNILSLPQSLLCN